MGIVLHILYVPYKVSYIYDIPFNADFTYFLIIDRRYVASGCPFDGHISYYILFHHQLLGMTRTQTQ